MSSFDRQIIYWAHMLDEAFQVDESSSRRAGAASRRMRRARSNKYDEFYTSYENAEKLLMPFKHHLRGKRVLMPCDNPDKSEMFKWVFDNFDSLGLASLSCTGYGCTDMLVMDSQDDYEMVPITNNGDFTRGESLEALDACDVVIGNPPFSRKLGVQFLLQPIQHGKDVIGIETCEKCTYGELLKAVLSKTLTVYTCPYELFNVPVDANGDPAEYDTGTYVEKEVQVYAFSTWSDVHELKTKLAPFFAKATQLGARYSDLPDAPCGPRADRVDIKLMFDKNGPRDKHGEISHTTFAWIPPKPKSDGISKPMIAFTCYVILGCNWERYFNIEKKVSVKGVVRDPVDGEALKTIDTKYFVFSYK